ncbi:MAG: cupin domain-containing protein [Candidatus Gastranaerophilales bacterium]|nr:cupin domain-containing protein [Candidatus Gastranaerophilales bacterium]
MNVSQVKPYNLIRTTGSSLANRSDKKNFSRDRLQGSSLSACPCNYYNLISFGATATDIKSAFILGCEDKLLQPRYDGGYDVDNETDTVLYYGEAAKNYLRSTTYYDKETQVIAQSDCRLSANSPNRNEMYLNEPGAILIPAKTYAKVNVIEGNPMVVITGKMPYWYSKMSPFETTHREFFELLTDKNKKIFADKVHKKVFIPYVKQLEDCGFIYPVDSEGYTSFRFNTETDKLKNHLTSLNIDEKSANRIVQIYSQYKRRNIFTLQNEGEVKREYFCSCPDWVYDKLLAREILKRQNDKIVWNSFYTIDELQKELWDKVQIYGDVKNEILAVWLGTTKSGFDISGLANENNDVTVYLHKDKINQHNSMPTEWITNSTAWTRKGTFINGVSRVYDGNDEFDTTVKDFNIIRPEEEIHKHQNASNLNEKMTEVYVVTQGEAAMCAIVNGQKSIKVLKKGDCAVVPSGLEHGIVAIKGKYEHLCTQAPSSFHYGLKFKNIVEPFNEELKTKAKHMLNNSSILKEPDFMLSPPLFLVRLLFPNIINKGNQ